MLILKRKIIDIFMKMKNKIILGKLYKINGGSGMEENWVIIDINKLKRDLEYINQDVNIINCVTYGINKNGKIDFEKIEEMKRAAYRINKYFSYINSSYLGIVETLERDMYNRLINRSSKNKVTKLEEVKKTV